MSSTTAIKGLNPVAGDDKTKIEQKINPVQYYVKFSFSITYIFLLTTATITFIEAMRTNIPNVRHVLNLETAISLIASYFYSVFLYKISIYEKEDRKIDWADISSTRYIDWSMTTPMMLLALSLVLTQNIGKSVTLRAILTVVALNFIMLYLGYLGEIGTMDKLSAMMLGFVALFGMFYVIFTEFVLPKYLFSNYVIFGIFLSIWIFYGVFYMMSETYKNIGMNILDCLAKCCFGLGLWAYYSKIVVL
jgi:bacteriorhodopsin